MSDGTMVAIFGALLAAGASLFLWQASQKNATARSKEQGRRDAQRARLARGAQATEPKPGKPDQARKEFGRK